MVKGRRESRLPSRLALGIGICSSLFAAFLLYQINGIVHGTLYSYGLQFSNSWALTYWGLERLLYACLFIPSLINGAVLVLDLLQSRNEKALIVVKRVGERPSNGAASRTSRSSMKQGATIKCPNCKHTLNKYLNVLDSGSGKAFVVRVCPYCKHRLDQAEETGKDVRVLLPEKDKQSIEAE